MNTPHVKHTSHSAQGISASAGANQAQTPATQAPVYAAAPQVHSNEAYYSSLFEHSPDGVFVANTDGFVEANPRLCAMLGYTRQALLEINAGAFSACIRVNDSADTSVFLPADQAIGSALLELNAGRVYQQLWQFRRADGTLLEAEVIASCLPDGNLLGVARMPLFVNAREQVVVNSHEQVTNLREQEISRLSRLYSALSQINQAIVWMSTREELFHRICQILVEHGGFSMAWIGWHNAETKQIEPAAMWGDDDGYTSSIKVYTDERPEGQGPISIAFRTGKPYICNDMQTNPLLLPWREAIKQRNFHAYAVFPIHEHDTVLGTLSVYAESASFFNRKETVLLEEAASNISFCLENFRREHDRRVADTIAKNEKQFSDTMIESMPGILYFYDQQGRFLRWNKNFEAVSGYSAEEISNMHPLDFFADDEKQALVERISEVFKSGISSVEASFISKNGEATPHFFTGRKVSFNGEDCLVGVGIDITQLKQAERRLVQNEQKYRELVEHANSIILRWDAQGRITFLNQFGLRFFGYSLDEIVGLHVIGTLVPSTDSSGQAMQSLMEKICANPTAYEQHVNQNVRRNGELVWVAWTNRFVSDAEGTINEILSIGLDITKQHQAEETVRELNAHLELRVSERTEQLNSALMQAEAADRIKSAFLATMSHELRTPLNSIIGFTGIILQELAGPINPEQAKQLGMVRGSARHLLELINDVLDISKIEAGQLDVKAEHFDPRISVERVMSLVQPMADKKHLQLVTQLPEQIGMMFNDRRRFEQILINLLNNAIKFTEHGTVTLTVQAKQLGTLHGPYAGLCVQVRDTGIGIQAEDMERLFQAFHQIDTGLSRQHEGTGLGLAICRRLSALMGGDISVRSIWRQGSEFTLTLPLSLQDSRA